MDYLSPCRRGLLPLKKRRKLAGAAAAAAGRANGHQTDDSSSSGSNVVEPSPEFSLSKGRGAKGAAAKMSSMGVLASAAAFASSSIVSASSPSTSDAAAASFLVQSDSSSPAMSAPSIPVLQGMATTAGKPSPTNKSRTTNYQDRRFTDSDPPEARCQATTTRGRACAFVSIGGTKYCNVHANYDTAPPPRRSGFGDGGGKAKVAASPRKAPSVVTSSSSSSPHNERKKTTNGVVQMPDGGTNRPLLNNLPSIQWPKKVVEIAVGPFTGEKGIVLKFGNGWVTVKVKGRPDGKPLHHNRRSMELYLLPEDGRGDASAQSSSKETSNGWASPKITTPSSSGKEPRGA